jgi:hypothetical protein
MDWGGKMFTVFTVRVCQLLEGHSRPGNKRVSLAVRVTEQEVHERSALNPQFIHTHETPFARSVANQRAVLNIHLAKLCPKQERFTRVHRMPFVPHVPGLSHTHGDRAVLHSQIPSRPDTGKIPVTDEVDCALLGFHRAAGLSSLRPPPSARLGWTDATDRASQSSHRA